MPHLSWNEVRERAVWFSREHADDASESAQKQTFWNEFFNVFGLRRASLAAFEANVTNIKGNKGAIDLLWRGKLLVEHKSKGEDLDYAKSQAFTYIEDLTRADRWDEIPRYVLVSDFAHFVLYDLEPEEQRELPLFAGRKIEHHRFPLKDFPKHIRSFAFMLGQTRVRLKAEDPANQKAYDRMCELHDALKDGGFTGHDLECLLVRVLFCVFAEDTLIFQPEAFTQFIRTQTREEGSDCGAKLNELFDWLNDARADGELTDTDPFYGFRYVNGGLFAERLGFPRFTKEMREKLLACCDFQWAKISPAVFGSLFQGVLDEKARRQQGAHYTSERDIMKVIHSLFLDELDAEWKRLCIDRSTRRLTGLLAFHERLRSLNFLDPACGCGNFLVLAYRELRKLEIEVVREVSAAEGGQQFLPTVNVDQFHGIEYSEWPVRIAEVALWLMDHQMNAEASDVFGQPIDRLPLKTSPHIVHGNALQLDWQAILPRERCSYVLGNPPFIGKQFRNAEQQADMEIVWGKVKGAGVLDYVTCWYVKASAYIQGSQIPVAFVSTNSITQGEQVGILWGELFQHYRIKIHFGHRTFPWASEARGRANVHVVIVGFAAFDRSDKFIYDYDAKTNEPTKVSAENISPYLVSASDIVIARRTHPHSGVPEISFGSMPNDGGHLMMTNTAKQELLAVEPQAKPFIRQLLGSEEFINGISRWCLWLKDAAPGAIRALPAVLERVEKVREHRRSSSRPTTNKLAATPSLFAEIRQPSGPYLLITGVSSELRKYVPIGFVEADVIANNLVYCMSDATAWHFGILNSGMHTAWVRIVAGRMKSDYRYSASLVYNNFPWPSPTPEQRTKVEQKAQAVLDARAPHLPPRGMSTLADLYDPLTMPPALAKAHAELDQAVERCYSPKKFNNDRERVEHLFRLYEKLTAPLLPASPKTKTTRNNTLPTTPRPRRSRTPSLPEAEGMN